eukprot:Mycagemm_TRINITY_DN10298_c1_g4::TRINITY_DN10298_c1_g4_i1::g.4223::m.4223 type:complete len:133 gc:universal TRINITY_DN10298_c1_g4_i1:1010-612(-)
MTMEGGEESVVGFRFLAFTKSPTATAAGEAPSKITSVLNSRRTVGDTERSMARGIAAAAAAAAGVTASGALMTGAMAEADAAAVANFALSDTANDAPVANLELSAEAKFFALFGTDDDEVFRCDADVATGVE